MKKELYREIQIDKKRGLSKILRNDEKLKLKLESHTKQNHEGIQNGLKQRKIILRSENTCE